MATTPSIKIVKTMPYRGAIRSWSNRHHLSGGTPSDLTHWDTLADAIVAAEKLIYSADTGDVTIVNAIYYDAGSDLPIGNKTYSQLGTGTTLGGTQAPGDCAALIRFSTTARSAKNHPIYLFSYMHGPKVLTDPVQADKLATNYQSALQTYANAWVTGFSDGTVTHKRAGPNGAVAQGAFIEDYVTHRDLPR